MQKKEVLLDVIRVQTSLKKGMCKNAHAFFLIY